MYTDVGESLLSSSDARNIPCCLSFSYKHPNPPPPPTVYNFLTNTPPPRMLIFWSGPKIMFIGVPPPPGRFSWKSPKTIPIATLTSEL